MSDSNGPAPTDGAQGEPAVNLDPWTAPKDAAERDARLRAMPGGRQAWNSSLVIFLCVVGGTVFAIVQGAVTGTRGWFGLAVIGGAMVLIMAPVLWFGRAAREATAGGPSRRRRLLWALFTLAALGGFVLGATSGSALGILWYALATACGVAGYRVLRR